MTIDQRYGHRLFDRIHKQLSARKPGNHLRMNGKSSTLILLLHAVVL
jgi:hypothetical protein